jgi:hypothetical protein
MGWEERDYTWHPQRDRRVWWIDWGHLVPPPATLGIVGTHLLGYLAILIVGSVRGPEFANAAALAPATLTFYGLLFHPIASSHGLVVMVVTFWLWHAGGRIERAFGPRRLVATYVLGNLVGGLGYAGVVWLVGMGQAAPLMVPLGAMGGMTAFMLRCMPLEMTFPAGRPLNLTRVLAWSLVIACIGVSAIYRTAALPWIAAGLLGMGIGLLDWPSRDKAAAKPRRRKAGRPSVRAADAGEATAAQPAAAAEIDEILAKISRSGLPSLTDEEKRRLDEARKELLS